MTGNQKSLENKTLGWAEKERLIVSPAHYTRGSVETWDFIDDHGLTYDEGNVVKYIVRHRDKNGLEDIKKAIQYAKHIAKRVYGVDLDAK